MLPPADFRADLPRGPQDAGLNRIQRGGFAHPAGPAERGNFSLQTPAQGVDALSGFGRNHKGFIPDLPIHRSNTFPLFFRCKVCLGQHQQYRNVCRFRQHQQFVRDQKTEVRLYQRQGDHQQVKIGHRGSVQIITAGQHGGDHPFVRLIRIHFQLHPVSRTQGKPFLFHVPFDLTGYHDAGAIHIIVTAVRPHYQARCYQLFSSTSLWST